MRAVTLKEAKAHLNELVEAALSGEQVVLLRGSKHVAAIMPLTSDEIEIAPRLTDAQAEHFWQHVEKDKTRGRTKVFASATQAATWISHRKRS